jgi:hypothetical protein
LTTIDRKYIACWVSLPTSVSINIVFTGTLRSADVLRPPGCTKLLTIQAQTIFLSYHRRSGVNPPEAKSPSASARWHHTSGLQMGTVRDHSGNIQGTFREHSGNIEGTFT